MRKQGLVGLAESTRKATSTLRGRTARMARSARSGGAGPLRLGSQVVVLAGSAAFVMACGWAPGQGETGEDVLGEAKQSGSPSEIVGEAASAWSAEAPDDEGQNSHLFLVNGAIEALGRQPSDPTAVHAWERFRLPVCRRAWQNGLFDADHKASFHGGRKDLFAGDSPWRIFRAGARFESHFYHPITQRNWRGKAMPTAKSEAETHAQQAVHWFSQWDLGRGCYEAGLSLHFMTDIAQPMHAALFTALTPPLGLHSNLENEVDVFKDAYRIKAWGLPSPLPLPDLLQDIALESLAQWGPIWQAISEAYRGRCFPMSWHVFDAPRCWKGDPTVEALAGASLQTAQRRTAQYLHALERATELYREENRAPTVVSTGSETATEATGILEHSSDEFGFFRLVRASDGEEGLPSQ